MADEKHPGGRPLKFQSVEELEASINAYFAECDRDQDSRVYSHGETFEWPDEKGNAFVRCKECRGVTMDEYGQPEEGWRGQACQRVDVGRHCDR